VLFDMRRRRRVSDGLQLQADDQPSEPVRRGPVASARAGADALDAAQKGIGVV
jgi:hypothetical protein